MTYFVIVAMPFIGTTATVPACGVGAVVNTACDSIDALPLLDTLASIDSDPNSVPDHRTMYTVFANNVFDGMLTLASHTTAVPFVSATCFCNCTMIPLMLLLFVAAVD